MRVSRHLFMKAWVALTCKHASSKEIVWHMRDASYDVTGARTCLEQENYDSTVQSFAKSASEILKKVTERRGVSFAMDELVSQIVSR